MIEGYGEIARGDCCLVLGSSAVRDLLQEHQRLSAKARKDVHKVGLILRRLAEYGYENLQNTEQFKRQGKFPTGMRRGGEVAVYAVKSFQLRVYGGFIKVTEGTSMFACVEGAVKKRDSADQSQLLRVAKVLGEINDQFR